MQQIMKKGYTCVRHVEFKDSLVTYVCHLAFWRNWTLKRDILGWKQKKSNSHCYTPDLGRHTNLEHQIIQNKEFHLLQEPHVLNDWMSLHWQHHFRHPGLNWFLVRALFGLWELSLATSTDWIHETTKPALQAMFKGSLHPRLLAHCPGPHWVARNQLVPWNGCGQREPLPSVKLPNGGVSQPHVMDEVVQTAADRHLQESKNENWDEGW